MSYLLLFILELVSLFFVSKVVINSLAGLIYKFTKSHTFLVNFLAILFLPGTIIHELAHLLVAGILFVPVGELEVVPKIQGNGVQLGSVQIGYTDPIRRMVIGIAPILVGLALLLFGLVLLGSWQGSSPFSWQNFLAFYLVFVVGNTMFSSKKDMEGTLVLLLTTLVIFFILFLTLNFFGLKPWELILKGIQFLDRPELGNTFKSFSKYLLFPLVIDALVVILAILLKKVRL